MRPSGTPPGHYPVDHARGIPRNTRARPFVRRGTFPGRVSLANRPRETERNGYAQEYPPPPPNLMIPENRAQWFTAVRDGRRNTSIKYEALVGSHMWPHGNFVSFRVKPMVDAVRVKFFDLLEEELKNMRPEEPRVAPLLSRYGLIRPIGQGQDVAGLARQAMAPVEGELE